MGKVDQDRLDLLVGREKRTRKEFMLALGTLQGSLEWVEKHALDRPKGYVSLTTEYFDREVAPTLVPRLAAVTISLRALLEARDELAALRK